MARLLKMRETLDANGIPDEDLKFNELSIDPDTFVPIIHLYWMTSPSRERWCATRGLPCGAYSEGTARRVARERAQDGGRLSGACAYMPLPISPRVRRACLRVRGASRVVR